MTDSATRVLLIEDNASDAELVRHHLKAGGLTCEHRVVAEARAVRAALQEPWDVILADYNLPGYTALDVLKWLREKDLDTPVIVVTGMVGEETAAQCIVEGCTDYLVKDRLTRLPQAVTRALRERRTQREKREAERQVRNSERRFRALIENAIDTITLLDRQACIVYNAGAPILGHELESRLGRSSLEHIHPDDVPLLRDVFETALCNPGKVFETEFRGFHRDGTWHWIQSAAVNLLDEPAVAAVVTTNRDITDRRRTQEALSQRGEQMQVINQALSAYLENADLHAAIGCVLDHLNTMTRSAGAFVSVPTEGGIEVQMRVADNPGVDVTHRTEGESLLRRLIDDGQGLHSDDPKALAEPSGLPPCCRPERLLAVPVRVRDKVVGLVGVGNWAPTGTCSPAEVEALAPIIGTLYDIHLRAERQRLLERELNQAMKMEAVGRLAGGVAHDFNNLLTAVLGFGELALNELPPDHCVRDNLREVLEAARSASRLTRQLLTFSRREVVKPERIDLSQVVGNMARLLRRVIGEDIELLIAPGSIREILADPGQIEQVVMNLAVNARDAMPEGGRLEIRSRDAEGGTVCLSVRDTGCGMTEEVLAHIFEPFFTTKGQGRGTGLGLPTIYGIVQQAGGRLEVETAPNQGTTFSIHFPQAVSGGSSKAPPNYSAPVVRGKESVMVVEDDDFVRRLVKTVLENAGYRVLDAATGAEALRVLREPTNKVDLLLTDVVMPGMSGRQVADAATKLRTGLPVIYMSGYTDDAVLRCGISQGEAPFLQKPFPPRALLEKVHVVLHPDEAHAAIK